MSGDGSGSTVVVPTHNRPDALVTCLASLERQTIFESLEIVVVDDGSREAGRVAEAVARVRSARLIRLEGVGPAAARNAGARSAAAPFVCFTDDDCEPAPDWAERMVAALRAGAVAVAGRTVNGQAGDHYAEASQLIAGALAVPGADGWLVFAPSNNLACRADVIAAVEFPESMALAGGEDREWCARVVSAGYELQFEPSALVLHQQQLGFRGFWRQQVRYGRGAYGFRRAHGRSRGLERPGFYARLLRKGFARGLAVGILVCVAQVAAAIGFVRERHVARRGP